MISVADWQVQKKASSSLRREMLISSSSTARPASSSATSRLARLGYLDAVILATGGWNFFLHERGERRHRPGGRTNEDVFPNPCFTQIHPTCIPVSGDHQSKLTLMSESLERWRVCAEKNGETAA
jgi:hypothetical protein